MTDVLSPRASHVADHVRSEAVGALPVVSVERLSAGFGASTVLHDVSLEVAPFGVTAVIGPTGCGKSTLLRAFNRMNDFTRGYWERGIVRFHGTSVRAGELDPLVLRRKVGMVFQRPNPFPMSIAENVVAGVRAHRLVPRRQLRDVAEHYLREVGLWGAVADRFESSPFALSGGQQQLLCLARALAVEPEVLLLDEPTSALDPVTTEMIEELLVGLSRRMTLVLVTHNLAQARRVAATTAFLYGGRIVEAGPTHELFERPHEPETASYVSGRFS
jgi:phosphate transport system ATP-binding protein